MAETKKPTQLAINQALLDSNGNLDQASAELGIPIADLRSAIEQDESLRKRWLATPIPPSIGTMIHKGVEPAVAEALKAQEELLAQGLAGLGIGKKEQNLAMACLKFQKSNFSNIHLITAGGLTKCFLEVMTEIERITNLLEKNDWKDEEKLAMESLLREDRRGLLKFLADASGLVTTNLLVQAKIQKMLGTDDGKPKMKAVFGAPPVAKAK